MADDVQSRTSKHLDDVKRYISQILTSISEAVDACGDFWFLVIVGIAYVVLACGMTDWFC